jgi:septal ring factor EnvC (AmiA/AmiB activator)
MSNAWLRGLGAVAIALALGAIIYFVVQERRVAEAERVAADKARADAKSDLERARAETQKQMQALSDQKQSLDRAKDDAAKQAQSLNEAVDASKKSQAEQIEKGKRAKHLFEAIAATQSIKVAVAEHYQSNIQWPASNKEVGIANPESFRTEVIRSALVEPFEKTARIRVRYVDPTATEREIHLIASVNDAQNVSWQCVSPDQTDIASFASSCTYRAAKR